MNDETKIEIRYFHTNLRFRGYLTHNNGVKTVCKKTNKSYTTCKKLYFAGRSTISLMGNRGACLLLK